MTKLITKISVKRLRRCIVFFLAKSGLKGRSAGISFAAASGGCLNEKSTGDALSDR